MVVDIAAICKALYIVRIEYSKLSAAERPRIVLIYLDEKGALRRILESDEFEARRIARWNSCGVAIEGTRGESPNEVDSRLDAGLGRFHCKEGCMRSGEV